MKEKLQKLKKKIQELVPEVMEIYKTKENKDGILRASEPRDITLEDVLQAIEPKWSWTEAKEIFRLWRLNAPLSLQSEETINFLYDLICK